MTQEKLLNFITMENMKHILPIVRHNNYLMELIKSKMTEYTNANNEMIINTIKYEILKYDKNKYKYYESEILALTEII